MKIILATSNAGKIREIREYYKDFEVLGASEVIEPFEIIENGASFQQNALIKARAVWDKIGPNAKNPATSDSAKKPGFSSIGDGDFVVLSDDSGISVPVLGGEPGIYSARYSGPGATDASNRAKLIGELKRRDLERAPAFYTACIAIKSAFGEFSTHGFMHGEVIAAERGESGFGYDFMFIPKGHKNTIGELPLEVKMRLSHRTQALFWAKYILQLLKRRSPTLLMRSLPC